MRKWIYIALIVIFALIFLVSGWHLLDYYLESSRAASTYDELASLVEKHQLTQTKESQPEGETGPTEYVSTHVQVTDPETGGILWLLPEYAELYTMNTDTVGWVRIDGTRINYPVMQTQDSQDYYLKRDFYKEYSIDGSIYVREQCDVFTPSDNVTIYGHRMNSGAMFADLLNYKDEAFWAENRYIQFDTIREHHTYEILSVFKISTSADNGFQYHTFVDMDQAQFTEYVAQCKDRALYDTGVTAEYGDKLITLSTCEKGNSNMRVVIVAKRMG